MSFNTLSLRLVLGGALCASLATAAPPNDTVYSSVAFILSGERTPFLLSAETDLVLTPVGAQQLYSVGSYLHDRYFSNDTTTTTGIPGLSTPDIDASQLYLLSFDTQYNDASAQAFLQGFYPPSNDTATTNASYPLAGYQYGWLHTSSSNDPDSIFVDGSWSCNNFGSESTFTTSVSFNETAVQTADLYSRVGNALFDGDVPVGEFNYDNAYFVYDYAQYQNDYNATVASLFSNGSLQGDLDQLRYLSDGFQWNTYGAVDTSQVSRIAGQTAAYAVLERFALNMQTSGSSAMVNALFANYPAFISLFSLLDLTSTQPDFYGMPLPGSQLVFELFASDTGSSSYPNPSEMSVRLLFRNGTDSSQELTEYMIVNSAASSMAWSDFSLALGEFAIGDLGQWCESCNSWAIVPFCLAYNSTAWQSADGALAPASSGSGISPHIAGVIGAVATLGALGLFLFLGVGCCGLRIVQARRPQTATAGAIPAADGKGGGFKGVQKLASDPDLKGTGEAGKQSGTGNVVVDDKDGKTMGHTRVGSWELKDTGVPSRQGSFRRSFDEEMMVESDGLGKVVEPAERV